MHATPVDRIRVEGLPAPFLKRLTLEGSGDRAHWTLLQAEGTLFDLPDERIANHELPFTPGAYRYVRVTWNDTNSGRVPLPRAVAGARSRGAAEPAAAVHGPRDRAAARASRAAAGTGSRLPAAGLPIVALDLDVAPGHVFRQATVSESRFAGAEAAPAVLGRGTLVRVVCAPTPRPNRCGSRSRRPSEAQIDLVVDDGSNPPLDLRKVSAVFAELPWIYFEAAAGRWSRGMAIAPRRRRRTIWKPPARRSTSRRTTEAKWGSRARGCHGRVERPARVTGQCRRRARGGVPLQPRRRRPRPAAGSRRCRSTPPR